MTPSVQCPHCGVKLPAPAHLAGQTVACGGCQQNFQLPSAVPPVPAKPTTQPAQAKVTPARAPVAAPVRQARREEDYEDDDSEPKPRSKPRRGSRKEGSNTALLIGLIGGAVGLVMLSGVVGLFYLLSSNSSPTEQAGPIDDVNQVPPFVTRGPSNTDNAKKTTSKKANEKQANPQPSQPARGNGAPNYLPLTQGNRWEYETGEGISKYSYTSKWRGLRLKLGEPLCNCADSPGVTRLQA